jgi:hypothetical protein
LTGSLTGYFGAGPALTLVPAPAPAPAVAPAPLVVPALAPAPIGIPIASSLGAGAAAGLELPVFTALARVFTVKDVWREWQEGFAGRPAVRELEEKWGSRWRPGNTIRVQFRPRPTPVLSLGSLLSDWPTLANLQRP